MRVVKEKTVYLEHGHLIILELDLLIEKGVIGSVCAWDLIFPAPFFLSFSSSLCPSSPTHLTYLCSSEFELIMSKYALVYKGNGIY